jgi:hypothetical protein
VDHVIPYVLGLHQSWRHTNYASGSMSRSGRLALARSQLSRSSPLCRSGHSRTSRSAPFREPAVNDTRINVDGNLILAVRCMEVRRSMVPVEHTDHNPKKP